MENSRPKVVKNIGFAIIIIGFAMLSMADPEETSEPIEPRILVESGENESGSFIMNFNDNDWEMDFWMDFDECENIELTIVDSNNTVVFDDDDFRNSIFCYGNESPRFDYIYGETYAYESNYALFIAMYNVVDDEPLEEDIFGVIGSLLCCSGALLASFSGGLASFARNQKQYSVGMMPTEGIIPQPVVEDQNINIEYNQTYMTQPTFAEENKSTINNQTENRVDEKPQRLDLENSDKEEKSEKKVNFWDNI